MEISVNNKSTIDLIDGENIFSVDFLSVSKEKSVTKNSEAANLKLLKDTDAILSINENTVSIDFYKKVKYLQFVTFSLITDAIYEINSDNIKFISGSGSYVIDFGSTRFSLDSANSIIVALSESHHKISIVQNIAFNQKFQAQNFEALTLANPFLIDETSKMPEFSIGIFDDAAFAISRPIRQGNPVISTVPAVINDISTAGEVDYYNSGFGPESKTVYFKIICNQILESALSSGDLSTNLQLKVYLPNGLDTVKNASYEDIYFVSKDVTNNISVYSSSYTFYKQGTHNNIDYVDGFMYFDVHCPLTVQKSLPFQFDFSI
jgi:hypothetical protein